MNFVNKLGNRLPTQVARHLGAHVEIDPRHAKVPSPSHEPSDVPQPIFRLRLFHMAKEVVGYYDVLRAKGADEVRIAGVAQLPVYSLPNPRSDPCSVRVALKYLL